MQLGKLKLILNDWVANQCYSNSASYREYPSPFKGEIIFHLTYKTKLNFPGISEDVVLTKTYNTQTLYAHSPVHNTDLDQKRLERLLPQYDNEFIALVEHRISEIMQDINPDGFI